jgi:hypothetical protein
MTLEIIVFIAAILSGIIVYWRESKSNRVYRFFNHLIHAKDLQMKADNTKGFVHKQAFLMRLVWITFFILLIAVVVSFVTPFNAFYIQYFASAVVGVLIGTYIASLFIFAGDSVKKENLEKALQKGKDFVEDLTDGDEEPSEEVLLKEDPHANPEEKKSARDRLKDKGMIK